MIDLPRSAIWYTARPTRVCCNVAVNPFGNEYCVNLHAIEATTSISALT
jgi:hypothetical protein